MNLRIYNVGHGNATHIVTPAKQLVVVDLGASSDFSPLGEVADRTRKINKLILTHPHTDHLTEIGDIDGFSVDMLQRPKHLSEQAIRAGNQAKDKQVLDDYIAFSKRYSGTVAEDRLIGNPSVSGGVTIKSFYSKDCADSNLNNHSAVTFFEQDGVVILIPGDNEKPSWRELLENEDFVSFLARTNVFLVSHHGRESGYCPELFSEGGLSPELCVVSDGPVTDTDVTSRYSQHAKGWDVSSRSKGTSEHRFCLTTRSDGAIDIAVDRNSNGNPTLKVEIE